MRVADPGIAVHCVAEDRAASERERLLAVLEDTNWNRRDAARRLGISDATIRRRIDQLGLVRSQQG